MIWAREIVVRVEYRHCPNLTIIDTPGLIAAAPGKQHESVQTAAKAAEDLVREKLKQKELIVLCLEDSSDWAHVSGSKSFARLAVGLALPTANVICRQRRDGSSCQRTPI